METNNVIYCNDKAILEFDSMIETSYKRSNKISTEYVEQGGWANDNKQRNPATITITAAISGVVGYNERINKAITVLNNLNQSETNVDIVLANVAYINMNLVDLDFGNDPKNTAFDAVMTFQQARLVATQYANIKNSKPAKVQNKATKQAGNTQPTATAEPPSDGIVAKIIGLKK